MEPNTEKNIKSLENVFYKSRILTAGTTPVPDFVLSAMSSSVHYHRGPDFAQVMSECRVMLQKLFQTKEEVMIFSGTGTLAMEGAVQNFFDVGDEVVAVNSGKFGHRWSQQSKIYGLKVKEVLVERGRAVDLDVLEKELTANTRGVLIHSSETSTGVRHPVKEISQLLKQKAPNALLLVDGVTSVGVFATPMDEWGIDVLVAGSQKGLMLPPGLSLGAASARAWKRCEEVKNVRYYNDWRKTKKTALENTGPFTSPVTLVGGLHAVLKYFEKIGYENLYEKSWRLMKASRAALSSMGVRLFVENENEASAACTSIYSEGLIDTKSLKKLGMSISGGQDELKGKILRVGHIGYMDGWDILCQILGIAKAFKMNSKDLDLQAGIDAFWKVVEDPQDQTPLNMRR
jgi:aspartate aminotransferase-like enzyme